MILENVSDGVIIMSFLDSALDKIIRSGYTATGIVIGTVARRMLSDSCMSVMGQTVKDDLTINRYRGVLIIEDGKRPHRVEIVHAKTPVLPDDSLPFLGGR